MCLSSVVANPSCLLEKNFYKGFEYNITNGSGLGFRCGYIKVEPGHPWHGQDFDDINADAHGGLTFSEHDVPCDAEGDDNGYWIGFDCCHAGDAREESLMTPEHLEHYRVFVKEFRAISDYRYIGVIRDMPYVVSQCKQLIDQAIAAIQVH